MMMIRNLKTLGLALAAVLALSAIGASAASATTQFAAESTPVTLTGAQEGQDVFTTDAGTVECEVTKYHGTVSTSPTSSVTVTPTYEDCGAFLVEATIHMNSCDYLVTAPAVTNTSSGILHIDCNDGDTITVTAHSFGTLKCTIHIPEQTIPVTLSNVGTGATREITLSVNTNGMTYTQTEGSGFGKCTQGVGTTHNGIYEGTAKVTGKQDPGSGHIGIFVN